MSKNLVIVESPAKSKTIEKYLGSDYKVLSSKGHIRDLATSGKYGFGVDIEDGFKPNYEPIKGKKKDIAELKKEVKNAEKVYLATDPDREGEAISWHLKDALGIDDKDYERIVFNEITKNAVVNSFKNARKICEVVEGIPLERLLVETDCPYMAPAPNRGKRNKSDYIRYIIEKIAEIKGISSKEVNLAVNDNFYNLIHNKK